MELAHVLRQPAPALHVCDDPVDQFRSAASIGACVAVVLVGTLVNRLPRKSPGQFSFQRLERGMLRLERAQDVGHILRFRKSRQDVAGIDGLRWIKDRPAHASESYSSGAGVAGIFEQRSGELQFALRRIFVAAGGGQVRCRIVLWIQAFGRHVTEKIDGGCATSIGFWTAGPERLKIPLLIKNADRILLGLAVDECR